ncbi:MAG: RHS repeat-associated core domain-containing protein [Elusimicrobiota bacterium]
MKVKIYLLLIILCSAPNVIQARYYDAANGRFISPDTIVQDPVDPQNFNRYAYVRNNPLILTDPSGNKWKLSNTWSKVGDLLKSVLSQSPGHPHSGASENRPTSPRNPGKLGMPNPRTSDLSSLVTIQQLPVIYSGPTTVFTWAIVDSFSDDFLNSGSYEKLSSNIFGHNVNEKEKRALASLIGFGGSYIYRAIVGYSATSYKGRGYAEKDPSLDAGIQGFNNIGIAHMGTPKTFFDEGNSFSQFSNNIFGVNTVAGMHDQFQVQLEKHWGVGARGRWNAFGMPIAAVMTYPTLVWHPIWLYENELKNGR